MANFTALGDLGSITASGAAAQATVSAAASGAGNRWVAKRLSFSLSAGATASVALLFVLRDGATGAGTIIYQATLACIANGAANVDYDNLHLMQPTTNAVITVETTAAGAATTVAMVNAEIYKFTP